MNRSQALVSNIPTVPLTVCSKSEVTRSGNMTSTHDRQAVAKVPEGSDQHVLKKIGMRKASLQGKSSATARNTSAANLCTSRTGGYDLQPLMYVNKNKSYSSVSDISSDCTDTSGLSLTGASTRAGFRTSSPLNSNSEASEVECAYNFKGKRSCKECNPRYARVRRRVTNVSGTNRVEDHKNPQASSTEEKSFKPQKKKSAGAQRKDDRQTPLPFGKHTLERARLRELKKSPQLVFNEEAHEQIKEVEERKILNNETNYGACTVTSSPQGVNSKQTNGKEDTITNKRSGTHLPVPKRRTSGLGNMNDIAPFGDSSEETPILRDQTRSYSATKGDTKPKLEVDDSYRKQNRTSFRKLKSPRKGSWLRCFNCCRCS